MKFVPPDTCYADYTRRRSAFIKHISATEPDMKRRAQRIRLWFEQNSPWEPHEKLENLKRAIFGGKRH